MAFTQLDKFSEFSALGLFKAKMREMEQAKNEAYASIEAMQEIAKTHTELLMEGIIATKLDVGQPYEIALELANKLHKQLEKIGVSKDEADEAIKPLHKYVECLMGYTIQHKHFLLPANADKGKIPLIQEMVNFDNRKTASTEEFWDKARQLHVEDDPETKESIENLAYFREYHKLRE